MDVKLAVLADYASIATNGKLNIMGIFDEINPARLPAALPIFYVVMSFGTHAAEFETTKKIEMVLHDEDGAVLARLAQQISVPRPARPGVTGTINQVHGLVGLQFPRTGMYQFAILINGQQADQIPLRVNEPAGAEGNAATY